MSRKRQPARGAAVCQEDLSGFACPNEDCPDFNRFGAGNLSVCERMGKNRSIRRLYCRSCGHRFSERAGTLLENGKLSEDSVVRIVKCLGYGCSVEATADICEVDPRTVQLLLSKAGRRADDFHQLALERLGEAIEAVQIDELHAPLAEVKKGRNPVIALLADRVGDVAARGFTWLWPQSRGS